MPNPIIILCGGNINHSNLPIATNVSNSMIPVNGKPVIGWMIEELSGNQGYEQFIIVLRKDNHQLLNFVNWAYSKKLNIKFAFTHTPGTILNSLDCGLKKTNSKMVSVILGDTLVRDEIKFNLDYVLVSDYEDPSIWCLAETDSTGYIGRYHNKQRIEKPHLKALVGFYHFTNRSLLQNACIEAIEQSKQELSAVLEIYAKEQPISAVECNDWFDFGHITHFFQAKKDFLQSRFFNQLFIHQVQGTIEKISSHSEKLENELNWYETLPQSLRIFSPRILEKGKLPDGRYRFVQEYYGYPNMAELLVYANLDIEIWKTAINNLILTHERFRQEKMKVEKADALDIYVHKTKERLEKLMESNSYFSELCKQERIIINSHEYNNLPLLKYHIFEKATRLSEHVNGCAIHGDYCLSNILYDINNQIIRLIDPRGSFGKRGLAGDPRYDMAKLRHSISGGYDYIVADLFDIRQEGVIFTMELFRNELDEEIARYFNKMIIQAGYEVEDIKLIEALLFLSMIPLHSDKPERQKMMYLTAIQLFNEIL